jgi:hypothetical protein
MAQYLDIKGIADGTITVDKLDSNFTSGLYDSSCFDTNFANKSTDNLTEGLLNLYYTDARSRASVCQGTGVSYNSTTGEISIGQAVGTTNNVTFNDITINGVLNSDDITAANITVCGNLTVTGTTTSVNSTTLNVSDINITLADGANDCTQANGAGITIAGADACLFYDSTSDSWNFNKNLCATINGQVSDISNHDTDDLAEGSTNLYYTDGRVDARIALSVDDNQKEFVATGEISAGDVVSLNNDGTVSFAGLHLSKVLDNPNAYDTSAGDAFGISVAISESYAIVGANSEDDAGGTSSGKAYIFDTSTGNLLHTLDNPNAYGTSQYDLFGGAVAISESYAIVGAYNEYGSSGKAYIFDTSTGNLLHTLDDPNAYGTSFSDFFGVSVAITESYAIVGAYREDDAGGSSSGKAYIFSTSTGNLLHTLDNPNAYGTSEQDLFGFPVAISESYAIVGALFEDDAGGTSSSKAYIFDTSTGNLLHTLDNPNAYGTSAGDFFGVSVSISESYAIVGADREDESGGSNSGKAYIFDTSTGNLLHTLDNPNAYGSSVSDTFGYSVSITESYAIVGARLEDDAGGGSSGKAYIFDTSTGNLLYTLDNPNAYDTSADDRFGSSVSITESYAIVGALQEDDAGGTSSGKAYIYNVTIPSNWLGIAAENIADTATGKIDLPGAVNKNQTGLVTNSAYYVSATGTLTSTFTSYRKIGKALSSTELQITDIGSHNTDDLAEGTNLYYTDARADARVDLETGANLDLSQKTTTDLAEGTNLYYTDSRADARVDLETGANLDLSQKTTDDLSEGSNNLYYTDTRFDNRFASKTTDNLNEGNTNLYYSTNIAEQIEDDALALAIALG